MKKIQYGRNKSITLRKEEKKCRNRRSESYAKSTDNNSLDYSSILPPFSPGRSISITWKRIPQKIESDIPGPGQYSIKESFKDHKIPISFGKQIRDALDSPKKSDQRGFYTNVYKEQDKKVGYSFSKKEKFKKISQGGLGPGHYALNERLIMPKVESHLMPLPKTSTTSKGKIESFLAWVRGQLETPIIEDRKGNFQRFSKLRRFAECSYRAVALKSKDTDTVFIQKNIRGSGGLTRESKLKKITEQKMILNQRIQLVQSIKQGNLMINNIELERSYVRNILKKSLDVARNKLIKKENKWKIAQSWEFLYTTLNFIKILSNKCLLRKVLRKHTDKLLRIIYVSFMSIGKFIMVKKRIRYRRLISIMGKIVKARHLFLIEAIKRRTKKRIAVFASKYEYTMESYLLLKIATQRISKLRVWLLRIVTKKRLLLAIQNYQWSLLENLAMKSTGKVVEVNDIENCIKSKEVANNVPIKVRIYFIKEQLDVVLYMIVVSQ